MLQAKTTLLTVIVNVGSTKEEIQINEVNASFTKFRKWPLSFGVAICEYMKIRNNDSVPTADKFQRVSKRILTYINIVMHLNPAVYLNSCVFPSMI